MDRRAQIGRCTNLRPAQVILQIEEELGRCPLDRLMLRIACGTADWPHSLEKALNGFWEDGNVGVYELLPLRRRDVRAAAEAEGIDPDQFVEDVGRRGAPPLAIKPVTLRMLINLYGQVDMLAGLVRMLRPDEVVIVADADAPGRSGAERLACRLRPLVRPLKIVEPPAGHKDLRAWR